MTTLSNSANYSVESGTYNSTSDTQTFELEISADANTEDTTYTCEITPSGGSAQLTTLTLNVFSKCLFGCLYS